MDVGLGLMRCKNIQKLGLDNKTRPCYNKLGFKYYIFDISYSGKGAECCGQCSNAPNPNN